MRRQVELALAPGERQRVPNEGEAFFVALAPASPLACGQGIGRGDPRPGLRRPRDWRAGGIVPRLLWPWAAPPETAPGPPAPLRLPLSLTPRQVGQPLGIGERAVPRCQDQLPEPPPLFLGGVPRPVQHGLSEV